MKAASSPSSTGLELHQLSVWRGRRQVLHELTLHLHAGELWALVGPNGSGKTSLLEALMGALPCSGLVLLGGREILKLPARERAQSLTLLGRELSTSSGLSVRGLVELGRLPYLTSFQALSTADLAAVSRAMDLTDLWALAERPLAALSDGERQRACLARALAQEPRLLLLDEATGHLDLWHREQTLLGIRDYVAQDKLALMVVHDLELAVRHATHMAILDRGRLLAAGPVLETLTPQRLNQVFGVNGELSEDTRGRHLRIFGGVAGRTCLQSDSTHLGPGPSHSKDPPCN